MNSFPTSTPPNQPNPSPQFAIPSPPSHSSSPRIGNNLSPRQVQLLVAENLLLRTENQKLKKVMADVHRYNLQYLQLATRYRTDLLNALKSLGDTDAIFSALAVERCSFDEANSHLLDTSSAGSSQTQPTTASQSPSAGSSQTQPAASSQSSSARPSQMMPAQFPPLQCLQSLGTGSNPTSSNSYQLPATDQQLFRDDLESSYNNYLAVYSSLTSNNENLPPPASLPQMLPVGASQSLQPPLSAHGSPVSTSSARINQEMPSPSEAHRQQNPPFSLELQSSSANPSSAQLPQNTQALSDYNRLLIEAIEYQRNQQQQSLTPAPSSVLMTRQAPISEQDRRLFAAIAQQQPRQFSGDPFAPPASSSETFASDLEREFNESRTKARKTH